MGKKVTTWHICLSGIGFMCGCLGDLGALWVVESFLRSLLAKGVLLDPMQVQKEPPAFPFPHCFSLFKLCLWGKRALD